jgi:hypothetical protein
MNNYTRCNHFDPTGTWFNVRYYKYAYRDGFGVYHKGDYTTVEVFAATPEDALTSAKYNYGNHGEDFEIVKEYINKD